MIIISFENMNKIKLIYQNSGKLNSNSNSGNLFTFLYVFNLDFLLLNFSNFILFTLFSNLII